MILWGAKSTRRAGPDRYARNAWGRAILAAALAASVGCATARTGGDDEDIRPPRKSVLVGELLAIFPGLIVHGLGHRYAGNHDRANEILTMELFSVLTAGVGGGLVALGESEDADALRVAGWIGVGMGAIPFLGTWIYDIVYTPSEIRAFNERRRRESDE